MPGQCRCSIEVKRGFSAGLEWRIEATAVGDNIHNGGTQGQGLSGNVVEGACAPCSLVPNEQTPARQTTRCNNDAFIFYVYDRFTSFVLSVIN